VKKTTLLLVVLMLPLLGGCIRSSNAASQKPPTPRVLRTSVSVTAPKIDGLSTDAAWANAAPLFAKTTAGTLLTMKAVTNGGNIYILLSWPDATNDNVDEVWRFDGANWTQGPIDDAVALFWNIDNSVNGFTARGCRAICHTTPVGQDMIIKGPVGGQTVWSGAKQRGDIWDMSLAISNVRAAGNDYYFGVDETYLKNPSALTPYIRRRHDDFTNKAPLELNERVDPATGRRVPRYRLKPGLTVATTPYPLLNQVEEIADYTSFKAGDTIPYIIFYPLSTKWGGSRDDIASKGTWKDGRWTVEFKRKLDTGHPADDIIFRPGSTRYYVFDAAIFNHSVAQHSYTGPISLEIDQ
jgi:hypothetical protein